LDVFFPFAISATVENKNKKKAMKKQGGRKEAEGSEQGDPTMSGEPDAQTESYARLLSYSDRPKRRDGHSGDLIERPDLELQQAITMCRPLIDAVQR